MPALAILPVFKSLTSVQLDPLYNSVFPTCGVAGACGDPPNAKLAV